MKQPKSNHGDFISRYGSNPTVLAIIWEDLQTTPFNEAWVPPAKRNLSYFFAAHHFLKQYETEMERKAAYQKLTLRRETLRNWVWFFVSKMNALRCQKIVWPESHIDCDDIWVESTDTTMSKGWEKAGINSVKDPSNYSHKHHSAGFNAEVGLSLWEPRCIWINGPEPAGDYADLTLFRKPGGLKEKLVAIGKKGIGDSGYSGERQVMSTPNGHDHPSVRKFKSRALRRHEKFNNMLKCFRVLDHTFRHTAYVPNDPEFRRYKVCFGAVAVICQYQLENGSPLPNILVGDM